MVFWRPSAANYHARDSQCPADDRQLHHAVQLLPAAGDDDEEITTSPHRRPTPPPITLCSIDEQFFKLGQTAATVEVPLSKLYPN